MYGRIYRNFRSVSSECSIWMRVVYRIYLYSSIVKIGGERRGRV